VFLNWPRSARHGTMRQRVQDGAVRYDWSEIDRLYDALLATNIRPFVELGFTPKALATSLTH
jgi:xylan 1,4-beta-xylosidase